MIVVNDLENDTVLVVSERGYGKRSAALDYRETNRGGKGVKTLNITEKTGNLIAIQSVTDDDGLMIINKSGVAIRMSMDEMRIMGRNTQGVKVINLKKDDEIAAIAKIEMDKEVEEDDHAEVIEGEETTTENNSTDEISENSNSESENIEESSAENTTENEDSKENED